MSWSINFIGTPENVSKALKDHSSKLDGASKAEYDAAMPHIEALVSQNKNDSYPPVLKVNASGHAYSDISNCTLSIMFLGGQLV